VPRPLLPESLQMFLMMCPALAAYIAYLYAASKLDRDMRSRHPATWDQIVGERDVHSSSNAFRLFLKGKELRVLNDEMISRQLDLIRYIFWVFLLGLIFAFLFA